MRSSTNYELNELRMRFSNLSDVYVSISSLFVIRPFVISSVIYSLLFAVCSFVINR